MASEAILLKAKANKLGIEGYRTMDVDTLKRHIAQIEKGATANGKSTSKTAPAKSTARKSPTRKTRAAQGTASRATTAKRKTTARKSAAAKRAPVRKTAAKRAPARKATATKRAPARKQTRKTGATRRTRNNESYRAGIDRKGIDWRMESNIGKSGKRKDVMDALKRYSGNYDKVFDLLAANAKRYYPGKSKHDAEITLRWLINRVAYDYVMATEQHEPGVRAAYGTAKDPINTKRREQRAKATRSAKRGSSKTAARSTRKAAPATRARKAASTSRKSAAAKRAPVKRSGRKTVARKR